MPDQPWQDQLIDVGPSKEERITADEVMEILDIPDRTIDRLRIEIQANRCPQPVVRRSFKRERFDGKPIFDYSPGSGWRWRRGDVEAMAAELQRRRVENPGLFQTQADV